MTVSTLVSPTPDNSDGYIAVASILQFWSDAGPTRWFEKNAEFDAEFRARFYELHMAAAARKLDHWTETASGTLALVILLDQFPRNAFRDTAHMYATDPLARYFATLALERGYDVQIANDLRLFLYMPFMHSEELVDQKRSLSLQQRLGFTRYAEQHYSIIARFGRFPQRNRALGRVNTPDEQAFLDAEGFSG